TKVSNLPQPDNGQEVLIVIDGPHSGALIKVFCCPSDDQLRLPGVSCNLQLNCIVLGDSYSQSFSIKITGTANVNDLKDLIKQKK
ncbi:hypothetical protein J3R82DRAFT_4798, partial [Butyriboletus roseoflavus]